MHNNNDLETARNILRNAVQMNMSQDLIIKISQKLDEYINEYYREAAPVDKPADISLASSGLSLKRCAW
ncbi:MAG: aspartyl-phosphate phosphatase Spo0E family protein [Syntrophomonadaceae bacterium]|nr:aspartyl-phosphate phosphatase Spo0E family protein [Syntrophomonadaceae bacterium]